MNRHSKVNSAVCLCVSHVAVYRRDMVSSDRQISDRANRAPPDISFRGVILPTSIGIQQYEEWWLSIPEEVRPHKDQPFYHLLMRVRIELVAYVSGEPAS
jgi:heat shock protein HspQ